MLLCDAHDVFLVTIRWVPTYRMSHTGVLSVCSPRAARTRMSLSPGDWQCWCSSFCPRMVVTDADAAVPSADAEGAVVDAKSVAEADTAR